MPSGYKKADVQCPFYKYDDGKRRITCEGITEDSSLALIYHNKRDYFHTALLRGLLYHRTQAPPQTGEAGVKL